MAKRSQRTQPRRQLRPGIAKREPTRTRAEWIAAGVILFVSALIPIINAALPIIYDEHYTLREYASHPLGFIRTQYELPNNHIGFTLLLRAWLVLLDAAAPGAYLQPSLYTLRLPVVACAIAAIAVTFLLARRLVSPDPIISACCALVMISAPNVALNSFQLRGYIPSILYISAVLLAIAYAPRWRWSSGIVLFVVAAAAQYTLPTNAWFLAALTISATLVLFARAIGWIPDEGGTARHENSNTLSLRILRVPGGIASLVGIVAGTTLGLYLWRPVWGQLQAQNTHKTDSVAAFVKAIVTHTRLLLEGSGPSQWPWLSALLLMGGLIGLVIAARRRDARARLCLLMAAAMLPLTEVIASAMSTIAYARNYTVAAPAVALVLGWLPAAVPALTRRFSAPLVQRSVIGAVAIMAAISGWITMVQTWRDLKPDQVVARIVKESGPRALLVYEPEADALSIDYYAYRVGMPQPMSYDSAPPNITAQVPTLYLAAGSKATYDRMIARFGLQNAGPKLTPLGQIGRITLAKYSR